MVAAPLDDHDSATHRVKPSNAITNLKRILEMLKNDLYHHRTHKF